MKPCSGRLAALALLLCAIASCGKETRTIATPSGSVQVTKERAENVPQRITPPSDAELRRIKADAERARKFLSDYAPGSAGSLADFDRAFKGWQVELPRRYSSEDVVAILGAHLGERLVAELDMQWVVVEDQYGRDLGVRSNKVEVISYPFSSVAKRIEREQYDFMEGVYYAVQDAIQNGGYKTH
jgi:uncharacterized protein DUF3806